MGTIQIDGSTPKLTIGNATAEDATILFDGNAQDFYIALDDSADDLLIGLGSTVGTTPAISINEDRDVTISDGAIDFDVASHDGTNGLKLGGTLVTTTAAEINLIDGGTARGTTAIVDADGVLINDDGTMRMTTAATLKTYIGGFDVSSITGATALATQPASDDEIVLSDAGTLKRLDIKHISNTPAFMATLSGDQALSDATETKLEFATEVLDSDGKYDNSSNYRFTPTVAGRYLVCLTVFLDSNNDGSLVNAGCILFKNGSGIHYAYHSDHDATGRYASPSLQAIVTLDADDYIEAYGYCDVDGSGSAAAEGDSNTMFCAIRLTGLES
jgi:hypothetical protein